MAHAVRFHEAGGPDVLRWEEVGVGNPGPGEVRLRHLAVGLNFADTYFRTGYYPVPLPNGMGVSVLGAVKWERVTGQKSLVATARNWRTTTKLLELLDA